MLASGHHLQETLSLLTCKLQFLNAEYSTTNVLLAVLAIAITAVVAEYLGRYAYMLYLRSKTLPGLFPWPMISNTRLLLAQKQAIGSF